MGKIARRTFLGSASVAAAAAGCRARPDARATTEPAPGDALPAARRGERQVWSACGLCPAGCGIRVRVVDGRAVGIAGNPHAPINRGGLCARGAAALQLLYHPDRVRGPMLRAGARGEGRWRPISWDEGLARLAGELGKLRAAGEPQSVVLLDGQEGGMTHALWGRFLRAFGSPNHVGHGATGSGAMARAMADVTGAPSLPGYDFANARLVLLVGTGALESSPQSMALARAVARGARPRLLCAWPRRPVAAALVDEWLPLRPGGEVALLLGLAHVLLREELADEARLQGARGFDSEGGLRQRILDELTPARTEAATGIPARRIERLARELAAIRPSVVAPDELASDGAVATSALVLNALLGGFDAQGGVRRDPDWVRPAWSEPALDPTAERGLGAGAIDGRPAERPEVESSRLLALPDALLSERPYPTKALLLYYSNPVFSKPAGARWRRAMAGVPFVVSFSPLVDESVLGADLVLPDATFLERWDVLVPGRASRALCLQQPALAPEADVLATGELVLRLARALGGAVAEAMPWDGYRQAVLAGLAGVPAELGEVLATLEREGAWAAPVPAAELALGWQGQGPGLLDVRAAMPAPAPVLEGEPAAFPFVLVPFRGAGYGEGGTRHLPWLRELPLAGCNAWPPPVELATADARRLGIRSGDQVLVESPRGSMTMPAHVHDGMRPGALGWPLGGGRWPASLAGPSPLELLADLAAAESGHWLACATRARVRKVA